MSIFSQKKAVLRYQETKTPKQFLVFSQKKAVVIFQERESQKKIPYVSELFYISGKRKPEKKSLYFRKWKP